MNETLKDVTNGLNDRDSILFAMGMLHQRVKDLDKEAKKETTPIPEEIWSPTAMLTEELNLCKERIDRLMGQNAQMAEEIHSLHKTNEDLASDNKTLGSIRKGLEQSCDLYKKTATERIENINSLKDKLDVSREHNRKLREQRDEAVGLLREYLDEAVGLLREYLDLCWNRADAMSRTDFTNRVDQLVKKYKP